MAQMLLAGGELLDGLTQGGEICHVSVCRRWAEATLGSVAAVFARCRAEVWSTTAGRAEIQPNGAGQVAITPLASPIPSHVMADTLSLA